MALKMVKIQVEPVAEQPVAMVKTFVQPVEVTALEQLTAEYIELWRKYDYFEVKALTKRMDEIRKQLVAVANETMDETKPAIFSCAQGEVEFSERGKVAEVPEPLVLVEVLLKKFGPEVAASVVDIAITPLRKILSGFELKKYLKDEPGARTIRAVRPLT